MPDTQDYRDEIARIFPAVLNRIAVASSIPGKYPLLTRMWTGLRYRWAESLRRDFAAQGIAAQAEHLERLIERAEQDDGAEIPHAQGNGRGENLFACVFPLLKNVPLEKAFGDFSMTPYRTLDAGKLDMPRDAFEWVTFYHELAHAALFVLRRNKESGCELYDKDREEAVCDAFAALMMIGRYGEKAVPYMEKYADMRLVAGDTRTINMPEYFTAPVIDRALFFARHIGTEKLNAASGEDMLALAEVIGTRAYLNPAQHGALVKRFRAPYPPKIKDIVANVFAGKNPDDPQRPLVDYVTGRKPRDLSRWLEKVKTAKEKYTL